MLVVSFPVSHRYLGKSFVLDALAATGPVWLEQSSSWHFSGVWTQPRPFTCLLEGNVRASQVEGPPRQDFGMQSSSPAHPPITPHHVLTQLFQDIHRPHKVVFNYILFYLFFICFFETSSFRAGSIRACQYTLMV